MQISDRVDQVSMTTVRSIDLVREDKTRKAYFAMVKFPPQQLYDMRQDILHKNEIEQLEDMSYRRRRHSFLLGRYAAKLALAKYFGESDLSSIEVKRGVFSQPIVCHFKGPAQIGISHADDHGAAVAFPEDHPMGIDIETIDLDRIGAINEWLSDTEQESIQCNETLKELGAFMLWSSKEAISKVLKTGLTTPFSVYEISKIDLESHSHEEQFRFVSHFKNFAQYKGITYVNRAEQYVLSFVIPKRTAFVLS